MQKPTHRLVYTNDSGDDSLDGTLDITVPSDAAARARVRDYVEVRNERNRADIVSGQLEDYQKATIIPRCLYRLAYVIREVEEATPISLEQPKG
jgi:hypothetical protein